MWLSEKDTARNSTYDATFCGRSKKRHTMHVLCKEKLERQRLPMRSWDGDRGWEAAQKNEGETLRIPYELLLLKRINDYPPQS